MSEELKELEESVEEVEPSERFSSPGGDMALKFLDQEFARIEKWINLKIEDGWYKTLVITQLELAYTVIRGLVAKALD